MTLICDDLKLYHRLTYMQNWYLQMYFKSKIYISNQTFSFQAPSIVPKWKFDNFHILTKNHTFGGNVYLTAICRSILGKLKIPTITAAVFKLQYQYQHVFHENMIRLHADWKLHFGWIKDIYPWSLENCMSITKNFSLMIHLTQVQ